MVTILIMPTKEVTTLGFLNVAHVVDLNLVFTD